MKKTILFIFGLFVVFSLLFSACSNDDATSPSEPTPVITVTAADSYENDNTRYHATVVSLSSTSAGHNHHYTCDEDWFKVTTADINWYWVYTSNLGTDADTYMYLYRDDGASLTFVNEDDNGGGGAASSITFLSGGSQDYYIKIVHYNCKDGSSTGDLSGPDTSYDFTFDYD